MKNDYLERILRARVYDVAIESPLEPAPILSRRLSNTLLLKREDMQPVFSFKLRGAYNKMAHLTSEQLKRGVICASAGNHAQGVALSAQKLGCKAVIVMPTTTPKIKVDAVASRGAEVVLTGESYSDASKESYLIARKRGLVYVHPYDDPDVIAGQGTIAMEILRQTSLPIHAIFVAIGGGGLISGIASYVKRLRPEIRVIGVQPTDSDAMERSVREGKRVALDHVGIFADGVAVKQVGVETFRIVRELVDEIMRVDTDAICAAMKDMFEDTRTILEPAGALSIAAAKEYVERTGIRGQNLVAIASGANTNFDRLRFVSERAEVGEHREALLAVTVPEEPGSFRRFCATLGAARAITEFNYRMSSMDEAHVFAGIEVSGLAETDKIVKNLERHGFRTLDLSHSEMAKLHVRHLVGGHQPSEVKKGNGVGELIYRFEFPERPGALMKFLDAMGSSWNISLFHYRNQGGDYGRVLVGMQVPKREMPAFRKFLKTLGYPYEDESANPAYRLFLG
jgi:threonine dehydratase